MKYIILLLLRCPVDATLTVIQAWFLKSAFNSIGDSDVNALVFSCMAFLAASAFLFLYNGILWPSFASNMINIAGRLRRKMMKNILSEKSDFTDKHSEGDILTLMNTDLNMTIELFGGGLNIPHFILAIVRIAVSLVLLYTVNIRILLIIMAVVIPHILLNGLLIARPMKRIKSNVLDATAEASELLGTMISCADTIKQYDAEEYIMHKYEEASSKIYRENMKLVRRNAFGNTMMPLFGAGGYLLTIFAGAEYIASGEMTFGGLTAILQYRGGVIAASLMLINCLISMRMNMAGYERIKESGIISKGRFWRNIIGKDKDEDIYG